MILNELMLHFRVKMVKVNIFCTKNIKLHIIQNSPSIPFFDERLHRVSCPLLYELRIIIILTHKLKLKQLSQPERLN